MEKSLEYSHIFGNLINDYIIKSVAETLLFNDDNVEI